jgi:hypothetical protein
MNTMVTWRGEKDITNCLRLKTSCKEDVHYKVVPHAAWIILHRRFYTASMFSVPAEETARPSDLVCVSVPVPSSNPDKPEHLVEIS